MPVDYYTIFDFDETLTHRHTFHHASLKATDGDVNSQAEIDKGFEHAKVNLKKGVPQALFNMNAQHAFGIATYHNNPDFIAGYVQRILGKRVCRTEGKSAYTTEDGVGMQSYTVQGTDRLLLIAYVPGAMGDDYTKNCSLVMCSGKNKHINELQSIVGQGVFYDFFDDTESHIEKAELLRAKVVSHRVIGGQESFAVENLEALKAAVCRAGGLHALADDEQRELSAREACGRLLAFLCEGQGHMLFSGAIGLLVAAGVLAAFALTAPVGTTALLTAAGSGLFAGAATYTECVTAACFTATLT